MKIHQILPNIIKGDAIGNETLIIRDILRKWGNESEIYAQSISSGIDAIPYKEYRKISSGDNILIYHYSIGSEITDFLEELPDRIIVLYHNMTPEKYFWGVNDYVAFLLHKGRKDLKKIATIAEFGIADSEFNRLEMEAAGFRRTAVLPLLLNFNKYAIRNEKILKKYDDPWVNIIFVGRIAPNKCQEDLIKIFYYYKSINPKSRLFIVGPYNGFEQYYQKLKQITAQLSLSDVIMTGAVSDEDLNAYYSLADIFLCMSEHEGFCVPLVESMFFNIPIIAYNSTAVPNTLGNSGILVNEKNYCEIAELVHVILHDDELKKRILEAQKQRLHRFERGRGEEKLRELLTGVISKKE